MFTAEAVTGATFVRTLEQHAELASTSDRALELCRAGLPELPLLVVAERQTAGRGRQGKSWWSAGGSLTFSLVVDPDDYGLPAARRPAVALAAGRALAEALAPLPPGGAARAPLAPWVKWPNDVCLGERKVAGVLVEAPIASGGSRPLVIGIGLNLNNPAADAPRELRSVVVSVGEALGRPILPAERADVLVAVCKRLERALRRLAEGGDDLTAQPACPLDGKRVRVETPLGVLRGEYAGVDADGALLLRVDGRLERVVSGSGLRVDGAAAGHTS